ncbi:G protein-coupled receptor 63 [Microdochium nivale]|nr:G protein-coupled receptor 63 [Microdochium nivale]
MTPHQDDASMAVYAVSTRVHAALALYITALQVPPLLYQCVLAARLRSSPHCFFSHLLLSHSFWPVLNTPSLYLLVLLNLREQALRLKSITHLGLRLPTPLISAWSTFVQSFILTTSINYRVIGIPSFARHTTAPRLGSSNYHLPPLH